MNKKRNDISKAELHANTIIQQAEIRKQKYQQEAYTRAMKEVEGKEKQLQDTYSKRIYDLSKEQRELEEGKVNNILQVRQQYEQNSESVVDFLIEHIVKVDLSIQRNIIGDFSTLKKGN